MYSSMLARVYTFRLGTPSQGPRTTERLGCKKSNKCFGLQTICPAVAENDGFIDGLPRHSIAAGRAHFDLAIHPPPVRLSPSLLAASRHGQDPHPGVVQRIDGEEQAGVGVRASVVVHFENVDLQHLWIRIILVHKMVEHHSVIVNLSGKRFTNS